MALRDKLPEPHAARAVVFDFDGVFTDNKVYVDQNGVETVRCDRADGLAFDMVRAYRQKHGLSAEMFLLSKEPNPVVLKRAQKLGIDCHHGIADKLRYMQARYGGSDGKLLGVIYLGNDLNDMAVMRHAEFSVAPDDAHPLIKEVANLVLPQSGGSGFVRSFIELWLGIGQANWEEIHDLVSNR
ncbi:MAG: haloacid dehalogenase [Rhizobiaceae bacterium]|nr:haloacid dehalogenase [Rhizobiaceae bacterium]